MRILLAAILAGFVLVASAPAHPCYRIVVDSRGHVFLLDVPGRKVIRIAPDGSVEDWLEFEKIGVEADPHALALGPDGRLHVAETYGQRIWIVGAKGKAELHPICKKLDAGLGAVQDLLFSDDGRLHLLFREELKAEAGGPRARYRLRRYESDGRSIELLDITDDRANLYPAPFALDREGRVWFSLEDRIVRVEKGKLVTMAGAEGRKPRDEGVAETLLDQPFGLAFAVDGTLLIAEGGGRRLRRLDSKGRLTTIAGSGRRGNDDGAAHEASFEAPLQIALRPDGAVVIVDLLPTRGGAPRYHLRLLEKGRVSTLARFAMGTRETPVKKTKEPASGEVAPAPGTSGDRRGDR